MEHASDARRARAARGHFAGGHRIARTGSRRQPGIAFGCRGLLSMDERVTLPRIQPQGLAWQEGSLTLSCRPRSNCAQLSPSFCQQSKTGPLPAPLSGESIELQCFGPEATADVVFARARQPVRCRMSTAVGLGSGEKSAQIVADLTLALGDRFSLRAEVPPEWIIDSISSVPENATQRLVARAARRQLASAAVTIVGSTYAKPSVAIDRQGPWPLDRLE